MKLEVNQIVKLRNGKVGVTSAFNGKAFLLVFASFVTPIKRYNDDLRTKNENYDIMEVYDGEGVEANDVFKVKFSTDNLNLIWKRE